MALTLPPETRHLDTVGADLSVVEELVVAAEAVDLRATAPLHRGTAVAGALVRERVPRVEAVTDWQPDFEGLIAQIADGELVAQVDAALSRP